MKKVLALFISTVLILSTCALSVSAMAFTDLAEDHWAYSYVQTLVTDGTVKGYEDGSFRPAGTVTRAEFVKMLGEGSVVRSYPYNDVSTDHWAYTYIMSANFPDDESNMFLPGTPITRGLVAELLWRRAGEPESVFIPSIITSQYAKNPKAAAWVYATGLIRGDGDGINLRLGDTLSRAEAATLIIRARGAKEATGVFADIVDQNIITTVYNALNMFDGAPYAANNTITNGEMARAALRIGQEQTNLSYYGLAASANFEHTYAKDLSVVFGALGKKDLSASFADKAATFGDTVAALSYQFIDKAHKVPVYGEKSEGLPAGVTSMMNVCLTYAKNAGIISLKEDLNKPVTVRDFTILCMLFDNVIGTQSAITTDSHPATTYVKADNSLLLIPGGYGDYQVKVEALPQSIYNTAFVDVTSTPAETYNFAREYNSIFMSVLQHLKSSVSAKAGVRLVYYPSLVCKNNNGYTLRVRCDVTSMSGSMKVSDLFKVKEGTAYADTVLSNGSTIYFDLATGSTISSVTMSSETAYINQIILAN